MDKQSSGTPSKKSRVGGRPPDKSSVQSAPSRRNSGKQSKKGDAAEKKAGPITRHIAKTSRPRPKPSHAKEQNHIQPAKNEKAPKPAQKYSPTDVTKAGRNKKAKKGSWLRRILWGLITCVLLGGIVAVGIGWSKLNREADPYLSMFQNRVPPTSTKVLDKEGNVLGIFATQKRTVIPYGDVPLAFQGAIVAVEDAEFWNHRGVSARGFWGALYRGIKSMGKDRSGFSTLTMQLVRTVTEKRERDLLKGGIKRKLLEIVIAMRLEKAFNKQQIMEQYANEVNFGAGHYGIEAASQYYFSKMALQLTIEESALLAALVQRPSRSHDRLFSTDPGEREIVRNRRNYVLARMAAEGYLKEGDAELLKERPIRLSRENAGEVEIAAYAVEEVRKQLSADEELRAKLEPKYGKDWLLEGGLEIYTTIDAVWQQAATDTIRKGLREVEKRRGFRKEAVRFYANPDTDRDPSWQRFYEPGDTARGIILKWENNTATVRMDRSIIEVPSVAFEWAGVVAREALTPGAAPLFEVVDTNPDGTPKHLELGQPPEVEGALLAIESATGEIRAMVGGYDFRRSQFNRATQALRQVGSAMKAFVYGAALAEGFTPATMVDDTPILYQLGIPGARPNIDRRTGKNNDEYQPRNIDRDFWGPLTFWESIAHSRNIPAVRTLEMAGINNVINFADKCGIDRNKISPFPSLALGAADLTLKEMVRGYATIASGGYQCPDPFLIKKIVDRDGKVLFERRVAPRPVEPDIDSVVNFQLTQLLQGVTLSGSAGGTSKELDKPVAGKTGTTNEYTDAWFLGFSSRITCGVWVGLDAKKTIYGPRSGRPGATGGTTALPIWTSFMRVALSGRATPSEDFVPPRGLEWIDIDLDTGLRAGPGSLRNRIRSLAFRPGTGPRGESDAETATRMREGRAKARFFELEERRWGVPKAVTEDGPAIDPNDY
ncbi:MAG: transglycosylase domain-containing protein [Holophagaceae bacterium]|nr:transglycosylase domain-containing protein [Holophagaceae bacterium]